MLKTMSATEKLEEVQCELHCSICHEYFFQAYTLSCSHSFCRMCINVWRQGHSECPICRQDISGMTPSRALDNMVATLNTSLNTETLPRTLTSPNAAPLPAACNNSVSNSDTIDSSVDRELPVHYPSGNHQRYTVGEYFSDEELFNSSTFSGDEDYEEDDQCEVDSFSNGSYSAEEGELEEEEDAENEEEENADEVEAEEEEYVEEEYEESEYSDVDVIGEVLSDSFEGDTPGSYDSDDSIVVID